MKKLSDFEKNRKDRISKEISLGTCGLPTNWNDDIQETLVDDKHGLCGNCRWFRLSITKYGKTYAYCREWEKYLNGIDPIIKCNEYNKRGQLTLNDMKDMAVIIEIDKKKVGF